MLKALWCKSLHTPLTAYHISHLMFLFTPRCVRKSAPGFLTSYFMTAIRCLGRPVVAKSSSLLSAPRLSNWMRCSGSLLRNTLVRESQRLVPRASLVLQYQQMLTVWHTVSGVQVIYMAPEPKHYIAQWTSDTAKIISPKLHSPTKEDFLLLKNITQSTRNCQEWR